MIKWLMILMLHCPVLKRLLIRLLFIVVIAEDQEKTITSVLTITLDIYKEITATNSSITNCRYNYTPLRQMKQLNEHVLYV